MNVSKWSDYIRCYHLTIYLHRSHPLPFLFSSTQYGSIEEMNVCDNLGDHLVGNVYIKV